MKGEKGIPHKKEHSMQILKELVCGIGCLGNSIMEAGVK